MYCRLSRASWKCGPVSVSRQFSIFRSMAAFSSARSFGATTAAIWRHVAKLDLPSRKRGRDVLEIRSEFNRALKAFLQVRDLRLQIVALGFKSRLIGHLTVGKGERERAIHHRHVEASLMDHFEDRRVGLSNRQPKCPSTDRLALASGCRAPIERGAFPRDDLEIAADSARRRPEVGNAGRRRATYPKSGSCARRTQRLVKAIVHGVAETSAATVEVLPDPVAPPTSTNSWGESSDAPARPASQGRPARVAWWAAPESLLRAARARDED